jgi:hypothetical protein
MNGSPLFQIRKAILVKNLSQDNECKYFNYCKKQLLDLHWVSEFVDPTPVNIADHNVTIIFCADLEWSDEMREIQLTLKSQGRLSKIFYFGDAWELEKQEQDLNLRFQYFDIIN